MRAKARGQKYKTVMMNGEGDEDGDGGGEVTETVVGGAAEVEVRTSDEVNETKIRLRDL